MRGTGCRASTRMCRHSARPREKEPRMPRVATLDYENATPEAQALLDAITERYGLATNMKRTLAHSKPALDALTAWYPLRDAVVPFLGERLTALFCHAISAQSDCLL